MATDFSSIEPLNQAANQAEDKALASSSASFTLPQKLQDAINSRFNNSAIVQQREAALQPVLTSADRSREAVAGMVNSGTILSPTQQQSIISARRAADVVPLISLNDLLQNQFGSIGDLVRAGTAGFQGQVAADQGAAQLARERANSALSSLIAQRELQLKEAEASRANAPNPYADLIGMLLGGQQGQGMLADSSPEAQIAQYPGIDRVSVNGFTEELPLTVPVGTTAEDDQTGYKATFTGNGWQVQAPGPGILEQLFGGISRLFGGNKQYGGGAG